VRTITIHLTDEIYRDLKSGMTARMLSCSAHGPIDAFIGALLNRIEQGDSEWTPRYEKREKEKGKD
jgi:hypothetical protein